MKQEFLGHLEVMSTFSPGGVDSPERLIEEAKNKGFQKMAITDRSTISWPAAVTAAGDAEMEQLILGWQGVVREELDGWQYPVIILAETIEGRKAISRAENYKLTSRNFEDMKGITVIAPRVTLPLLAQIVDREKLYARLVNHQDRESQEEIRATLEMAGILGIKTVATNEVWQAGSREGNVLLSTIRRSREQRWDYPTETDQLRLLRNSEAYKLLTRAWRAGGWGNEEKPNHPEGYLKAAESMVRLFAEMPEALRSVTEIARRCEKNVYERPRIPEYPVPEGFNAGTYLRFLCEEGLRRNYSKITPEIKSRLETELERIDNKGYTNHFLIIWDIATDLKSHGFEIAGIGSGGGSLVSHCLDLTDFDPIRNNLSFDRFLSNFTEVIADIDFLVSNHGLVTDEVFRRTDKVGIHAYRIAVFQTLKMKGAIRKVLRFFGFKPREIDSFIKNYNTKKPADDEAARLIPIAREMARRKFPGTISTHPTKFVFTEGLLEDEGPYKVTVKQGQKVVLITKEEAKYLSNLDTVSATIMDILVKLKQKFPKVKPDLNDPKPREMLFKSGNFGVPYVETEFLTTVIRQFSEAIGKPSKSDLVAVLALTRPGVWPILEDYFDRRSSKMKIEYGHPKLKELLRETAGMIIYQEQALDIAGFFGNFDGREREQLRKAMSKERRLNLVMPLYNKFMENAQAKGLKKDVANDLFEQIAHFVKYGFLKAHAIPLAQNINRLAWYKYYYPKEYMEIIVELDRGYYHYRGKPEIYLNELKYWQNKFGN